MFSHRIRILVLVSCLVARINTIFAHFERGCVQNNTELNKKPMYRAIQSEILSGVKMETKIKMLGRGLCKRKMGEWRSARKRGQ